MKRVIKKVFYPHHKHNPLPLFWHPLSVSVFALGVLFISGFLTLQKMETTDNSFLGDIRTGTLIALSNRERTNLDLPTLTENETLIQAAQLKANDMARAGYFAHYSPSGLSPWYWFSQAGYEYQKAGENLAVNFTDSKDVVNAWMNSPTHRDNIIKDGYTDIGIASAEGVYKGKNATFVVQLFGSPKIESATGFALAIEKKNPLSESDQTSVQGATISVVTFSTPFRIFQSSTFVMIILLTLLSLVILGAILILSTKGRRHTRKFRISIWILCIALALSLVTEISFFKDISITLIE